MWIKHNVEPRVVVRRITASARFGGVFEFLLQVHIGHPDFILNRTYNIEDRSVSSSWATYFARSPILNPTQKNIAYPYGSERYPVELMKTFLTDEFPDVNPLEMEVRASEIHARLTDLDHMVHGEVQNWLDGSPAGPITHANSAARLPVWDDGAIAALNESALVS